MKVWCVSILIFLSAFAQADCRDDKIDALRNIFVSPYKRIVYMNGYSARFEGAPSIVEVDTHYFSNIHFKERNYDEELIASEIKKMEGGYFNQLRTGRGFEESRIQGYQEVEDSVPVGNKAWMGVYNSNADSPLIGSLRFIKVRPEEDHILAVAQVLKKRGLDFHARELVGADATRSNLFFHEAGRASRAAGQDGDDAKKIWDMFFGFYSDSVHRDDYLIAHTDAPGALLYERDYGLKVKKRVFKDAEGKWHMVDTDQVLRKADPKEENEYIMIAPHHVVHDRIFDRIMTQQSFWEFFKRYPSMMGEFELTLGSGAHVLEFRHEPRYEPYFRFNHPEIYEKENEGIIDTIEFQRKIGQKYKSH